MAIAGNRGGEDFAGIAFVVLTDYFSEGIVPLKFRVDLDLLSPREAAAQTQENEARLPDHLM